MNVVAFSHNFLVSYSGHPSQFLGSFTYSLLASFMRHELISKDPVFQSIIPQIIEKTKVALTKVSIFNSDKTQQIGENGKGGQI